MAVPVEASEIEDFTPPSLANLAAPPVFKLRPATGREWRRYQYVMRAEGLTFHSTDDIRAEILRAVASLYTPDQAEAAKARLESYWALVDQKGEPDPAEAAAVDDLVARLTRAWRPLSQAGADNMQFHEDAKAIVVSMFTVGWTGIDLAYRREDGRVPLDLVDALEEKLAEIETQAVAGKVEGVAPGLAFIQLCNAAYARLHLTGDEEKNSSSPPPAPPVRSGSKTKPSRRAASSSKASASSEAAPTA